MSDASTLLDAAGLLATPTVQFPDTPESRNCIVVGPTRKGAGPGPADVPAFIENGDLYNSIYPVQQEDNIGRTGGLANVVNPTPPAPPLRGRAVAIPSLGCTITGIARMLLAWINRAATAASGGPLTETEFARAILAYNTAFLGYTGPPTPPMRPLPNWMAGMCLTLPLEFNTVANAWATNFTTIRTLAGTLSAADDGALGDRARALTLPAADAVIGIVDGWLTSHADILTIANDDDNPLGTGPGLRRQLLTNPSDAVFRFIEVFRQLRAGGPNGTPARRPDILKMVVGICEQTSVEFLRPVAQCTAGNAVLRRFQMALDEATTAELAVPDAQALARTQTTLATALSLVPDGASWKSMREWGPTVVPFELPLLKSQETEKRGPKGQTSVLIANVFGNPVEISSTPTPDGGGAPSWNKLSHRGTMPATTWLAAHGADPDVDRAITTVAPAAPNDPAHHPQFDQIVIAQDNVRARAQVAARISGAEGGLDSVQAGDKGLVSFGLQQWAAHTEDELTVFFERFRAQAPDHYDLFFGSAGLQTKRWVGNIDPVTNSNPVSDPASTEVDDFNPYGPDPDTLGDPFSAADMPKLMDYFPLYVTFVEVPPGTQAINIPAGKFGSGLGERYSFLMKDKRFRVWCGRARVAGLMSREYLRTQIHQAAFRFTRIEHEARARKFLPNTSAPFPIPAAGVTTLSDAMTAAIGTAKVATGSVFPSSSPFIVVCEHELMRCTNINGANLTVQRGALGTAAAAHALGASIGRASEFAAVAGGVDAAVVNIPVKAGGLYSPGSEHLRLACDQEFMYCTARTAASLTVQRGYEGTVAAPHADGAILYHIEGDTILANAIGAGDVQIDVNDGSFLPANGDALLRCGSEVMKCTANAAKLTVQRGQENTTAATHPKGAVIYRVVGYAELFNSELTAGAVLDIHINEPDIVIPAVYAAIRRTPGDVHNVDGSIADAWLRRFGVNYLAARAYQPNGAPWMNAGTRNNDIIKLHDSRPTTVGGVELGLSPDPGTFTSWERPAP